MKKGKFLLLISLLLGTTVYSEAGNVNDSELKYRRSSIYSILINDEDQQFASDIREQFSKIPVPDKYNDHSLSVRTISVHGGSSNQEIFDFINRNKIASRMVAKWFNRDPHTGVCDMNLIKARGLYDASEFDKETASHSIRGEAMLEDAGEDLIGNTFLLVNEVRYIDKNEGAKIAGGVLAAVGLLGGIVTTAVTGDDKWLAIGGGVGLATGAMATTYKGFKVIITTSLFQLVWDDEISGTFYTKHYTEVPDSEKSRAFEKDRDLFKLKYIGKVKSKGSDISFLGINENHPEIMVRKACQRAIDENIADLQHAYEQFRVKSPIMEVSPNFTVPIGKKEGLNKFSTYEILEAQEKNGRVEYVKVGTAKPIPSKIWDNRFMAQEEGAEGADLTATVFTQVSGKNLYPGMLIREL